MNSNSFCNTAILCYSHTNKVCCCCCCWLYPFRDIVPKTKHITDNQRKTLYLISIRIKLIWTKLILVNSYKYNQLSQFLKQTSVRSSRQCQRHARLPYSLISTKQRAGAKSNCPERLTIYSFSEMFADAKIAFPQCIALPNHSWRHQVIPAF